MPNRDDTTSPKLTNEQRAVSTDGCEDAASVEARREWTDAEIDVAVEAGRELEAQCRRDAREALLVDELREEYPHWPEAKLVAIARDVEDEYENGRAHFEHSDDLDDEERDMAELLATVEVQRVRKLVEEEARVRGHAPKNLTFSVYPSDGDAWRCTGEKLAAVRQRAVMTIAARTLKEEGVSVRLVCIHADEYFAWLGSRENTPATRAEFVARRHEAGE